MSSALPDTTEPVPESIFNRFRWQYFVGQMPWGVFMPFLVVYLKRDAGLSASEVGTMLGIGGIILLLTQQIWGYLGDVIIPRRTLIIFNTVVSGLLFLLFYFTKSYLSVAIVYSVFYLFNNPVMQLQHGFLFSYPGSEPRFARIRALGSAGYACANLLCAFLADRLGSLTFLFPLYLTVSLLMAAITQSIPCTQQIAPKHERASFLSVQMFFLARPEVLFFLLVALVYQMGHALSNYLLPLLLVEMNAGNPAIGLNTALGALLEVPVLFLSVPLIRRFGETRLIAFAAAMQCLRWMLVWNATQPSHVVLASLLHGITFGIFFACSAYYMNRKAGLHFKSSAQALSALVVSGAAVMLGNLLCSLIAPGGIFARQAATFITGTLHLPDHGAMRNLYLVCALLAMVSGFLALIHIGIDRRAQIREDAHRHHHAEV